MPRLLLSAVLMLLVATSLYAQGKPYRLKSVDLKQQVIWGSECVVDDNLGLLFGGLDQESVDGTSRTKIRRDGKWVDVSKELQGNNPWKALPDRLLARGQHLLHEASLRRHNYFLGLPPNINPHDVAEIRSFLNNLGLPGSKAFSSFYYHAGDQAAWKKAPEQLPAVRGFLESPADPLLEPENLLPPALSLYLERHAIRLQQAAEFLAAEPPPRALSEIVYDKSTNLFLLFGGDHLDYLTNDTWVFDPKQPRWELRHPKLAPPPRANHELTARGEGTITLSGGYTYANNTDYMGGQYVDLGDGEWTYNIARNEWTGGKGVWPLTRTYRTGKFHPDYFLQGPRPDRTAHGMVLESLPANRWVSLKPPHLPELNRDWGTAILDPNRDLILRWSGGHCAHSGSDVLHYHIATNRWELPFPVEFPLGQCYVNTEFPEGVNFNGRPWVTGHTYQSYGYDSLSRKMIFAGRDRDCFIWDLDYADWRGRFVKPPGMSYDSCFYTLTLTPSPAGLVCWTQEGRIFQLDREQKWEERKLSGEKLPGAVVDNSTIVYDSKRARLLAVVKSYGDETKFSGDVWSIDCASWKVSRLKPEGHKGASAIPYLCQLRYDAGNDLLLVGGTLPADDSGLRRTPAYDCAGNRWISLKITGNDPSGPKGRNVSLGMMYDSKRELFFAVDANSNVFALKLEPTSGDVRALK